jgi:hypothetical protein
MSKRTRCSICDEIVKFVAASTEDVACNSCNATMRAQMIHSAVLQGLGYPLNVRRNSISPDMSRVGLGISDDWRLARALAFLFNYTNSYLHQFPNVDLCSPPPNCFEYFEFISCSDVLEHTPPPMDQPMRGLYSMLKPGGFAVISVPLIRGSEYREFYPGLVKWDIRNDAVVWTDSEGGIHEDRSPEFHGGQGLTLAFRQWTEQMLIEKLKAVGFLDVVSLAIPEFQNHDRSICVLTARKRSV